MGGGLGDYIAEAGVERKDRGGEALFLINLYACINICAFRPSGVPFSHTITSPTEAFKNTGTRIPPWTIAYGKCLLDVNRMGYGISNTY